MFCNITTVDGGSTLRDVALQVLSRAILHFQVSFGLGTGQGPGTATHSLQDCCCPQGCRSLWQGHTEDLHWPLWEETCGKSVMKLSSPFLGNGAPMWHMTLKKWLKKESQSLLQKRNNGYLQQQQLYHKMLENRVPPGQKVCKHAVNVLMRKHTRKQCATASKQEQPAMLSCNVKIIWSSFQLCSDLYWTVLASYRTSLWLFIAPLSLFSWSFTTGRPRGPTFF